MLQFSDPITDEREWTSTLPAGLSDSNLLPLMNDGNLPSSLPPKYVNKIHELLEGLNAKIERREKLLTKVKCNRLGQDVCTMQFIKNTLSSWSKQFWNLFIRFREPTICGIFSSLRLHCYWVMFLLPYKGTWSPFASTVSPPPCGTRIQSRFAKQ